ncbi:hypothetical protein [Streptomyces sp.]|uniref:hypothetical protein n=1 Tax=Streptomyces sp. TaxID=1931 RepID=UPI002D786A59|nr:hypothetical protein [Streptomyces sp.]HET6356077.1 hypothetical protein [Streptomyces sp.]
MTPLRRVLARIVTGSGLLWGQFATWLIARRLRKTAGRLFGVFAAGWMLGGMLLAARPLLWITAGAWCVAAYRTARIVERREASEAAFVQWIRDQIDDRNGVLLAELLAGLHAAEMHLDWDVTDVRAVVERLRIPVRDSLKVAGAVSVGVHMDDLTAVWDVQLSPPPGKVDNPSPAGLTSDNYPTTPRVDVHAEGAQITITPAREGDN